MKGMISSVGVKGQVTLPIEIRRHLGLKPKDKVSFEMLGDGVKIVPVRLTLESLMGSVAPPTSTQDLEQIAQEVKEEIADKFAREFQQQ